MRDELAAYFTWEDDPGFLAFMRRADRLVRSKTGGLGVLDFADADWSGLYEDQGAEADDQAILDTLSDADNLFGAMLEGAG